MELSHARINFLGDSITYGCGADSPEKGFVSLIAQETGADCRNYGVIGTRIARQKQPSECSAFDEDFCQRAEKMDVCADAVVVFGGTNDFGHGDAPLGSDADRTPDTFQGALHTLFSSLMSLYPGKPILIITPLHRLSENNRRKDNGCILLDYVQMIRKAAEEYSLPILDLYAYAGLQPRVTAIQQTLMPDGLHPGNLGHQVIAHRIIKALENL